MLVEDDLHGIGVDVLDGVSAANGFVSSSVKCRCETWDGYPITAIGCSVREECIQSSHRSDVCSESLDYAPGDDVVLDAGC